MSTTASTTTPPPIPAFGYAGMVTDQSTGLNLTLYRAYDPKLRRWLSRDPVGALGGVALLRAGLAMPVALGGSQARWVSLNLAINRYPYVGNDPLNWGDPNGDIAFRPLFRAALLACLTRLHHRIPEVPIVPTQPPTYNSLPFKQR
ncbi:MAG: RHS repeat-associated core domain-containing protein [Acidiferrobacter sp.]